jgi:hypothetical protein
MSDTRTIWKYVLVDSDPTIEVPAGARVIEFAIQDDRLCVWAIVDPTEPRVIRKFHVVGTGALFEDWWVYRGTVHRPSGLVWHLLEESIR